MTTSPEADLNLKIAEVIKNSDPSDIVDVLSNPSGKGLLADTNNNNGPVNNNNPPKKLAQ
ncbi:hypothetical protein ACFVUH_35960 [Kitasatospora sp. NPDC058032]|uniref:hypothetical protein n=1 Tax=Kitasatospora sp. NPDC058032 TaxID=3346307 RepID=UPI0036D9C644